VRENNGKKEVHLSEMSKLIINPPGVTVEVKPYSPASAESTRKQIADIKEDDANIEILATIVQVFDINFFEVCPQCSKRIRLRDEGFMCQTHGKVTPEYNYVLNLYLDDGSDNIRVVFWRQQIEELLGMDKPQIMSFKDDPSKFEPIKTELLGNIIKVSGRANKNQNFDRIELVANKVDKSPDPDEEIKKLKEEADKVVEQKEEEPEPVSEEKEKKPFDKARDKDSDMSEHDFENFDLDEELVDTDEPVE
jgi:hypothetical protein